LHNRDHKYRTVTAIKIRVNSNEIPDEIEQYTFKNIKKKAEKNTLREKRISSPLQTTVTYFVKFKRTPAT